MPKKITSTSNITHDEWLQFRKNGIGGSDASAIVGLNPYKSLYNLWADKKGFLNETPDNEAIRIGNDLEDYVAKRFCDATDKKVRKNNFMYCHDKYDYIIANIDREVVGENAALECKTTNMFNKSDFENGEIPLTYYVQCQHYMAVMGYEYMYLAVLVLGKAFYHYKIERSKDEINTLIMAESDFWNRYIIGKESPIPDGSESTSNALKSIYGDKTDGEITLTLNAECSIENYNLYKSKIKKYELLANEEKNKILAELKDKSIGVTPKFTVFNQSVTSNRINSKELKQNFPDVYSQVLSKSVSSRFNIKEVK